MYTVHTVCAELFEVKNCLIASCFSLLIVLRVLLFIFIFRLYTLNVAWNQLESFVNAILTIIERVCLY